MPSVRHRLLVGKAWHWLTTSEMFYLDCFNCVAHQLRHADAFQHAAHGAHAVVFIGADAEGVQPVVGVGGQLPHAPAGPGGTTFSAEPTAHSVARPADAQPRDHRRRPSQSPLHYDGVPQAHRQASSNSHDATAVVEFEAPRVVVDARASKVSEVKSCSVVETVPLASRTLD